MKTTFNRFAKTTALATFMCIAFTVSTFARPTDVSKYLVRQFENQFHHASDVTWKTTSAFTSASFTMDNQKVSVFYTPGTNELIAISKVITTQDLPKAARRTLDQKYGNQSVTSVIDYTDANGNENYYIQLNGNNKQTILQSDESGRLSDYEK